MKFIDTHAHLNFPEFKKDLEEVIKRAKEKGIVHCIVVGINPSTNLKALELAKRYPEFISPACGFHPHEVKKIDEKDYLQLEKIIEKIVAIGEIGLDWVKEYSPKEYQIYHFEKQLELAKKYQKPVILHLRGNNEFWELALGIIKNYLPLKVLSHCFTSEKKIAQKILDLGGFISIPGVVTFPKAEQLRETVRYVPLDRLLIETDCPYLAPIPMRGKRNEPAFLPYTAQKIAEIKKLKVEDIAYRTTKNSIDFFSLML